MSSQDVDLEVVVPDQVGADGSQHPFESTAHGRSVAGGYAVVHTQRRVDP